MFCSVNGIVSLGQFVTHTALASASSLAIRGLILAKSLSFCPFLLFVRLLPQTLDGDCYDAAFSIQYHLSADMVLITWSWSCNT